MPGLKRLLEHTQDKRVHNTKNMKRSQGHPKSIFGKHLFGRQFEIYNGTFVGKFLACLGDKGNKE